MAFNFLNSLRNQFAQEEVIDQDNPVDEEEFAQGGEEEEEESADNVDLASESDPNPNNPNNPFPWSTALHDVEVELFTCRTGSNLDLDYSANPIDFFNLKAFKQLFCPI